MYFETIAKKGIYPFYFPTQIALIDDDTNFLKSLAFSFPIDFPIYCFDQAWKALNYFQNIIHVPHVSRALLLKFHDAYQRPPLEFSLNEDIVFKHLREPTRFHEISTAVVDFLMPEMDGLALSKYINKPIKKIILTGAADKDRTLQAFNAKQIDNYFLKNDAISMQMIALCFEEYQHNYFANLTQSMRDFLGLHHYLNNKVFQNYFFGVMINRQIVEYYLIRPGKFLCIDGAGKCYLLLVETSDTLFKHYEMAKQRNAPRELVDQLNAGGFVPYFPTDDFYYQPSIEDWTSYLYKQTIIQELDDIFVCALVEISEFQDFDCRYVYSLDRYRQNFPPDEFNPK